MLRLREWNDSLKPTSFNPHRARRPGATGTYPKRLAKVLKFQSSPGPEARCYFVNGDSGYLLGPWFQSSPGPEARCYILACVPSRDV